MSDQKVFVASDESKAKAKQFRVFAFLAWIVAIALQFFAIFKLNPGKSINKINSC